MLGVVWCGVPKTHAARQKTSKEEKSKQVNVRCGVVFLKQKLGWQQIST
jgi:hypothetical protein